MAILVTYDLKSPGRDYSGLHEELKKSAGWWHYLESVWILYTNENPNQVWGRIRPYLEDDDRAFIVEVNATLPRQGWLPQPAWDWLRNHLH